LVRTRLRRDGAKIFYLKKRHLDDCATDSNFFVKYVDVAIGRAGPQAILLERFLKHFYDVRAFHSLPLSDDLLTSPASVIDNQRRVFPQTTPKAAPPPRCASKEFPHGVVDHSKGQYVIGAIHTNTIEGFWSIFKRGVIGTFHKMSAKYMPLYVAEFQFRYNNRDNRDIFGTAINGC
jgi:hypothetical protein